jgi:hypothetical protein
MPTIRVAGPILLAILWLGCGKDEPSMLDPSSSSLGAAGTISGRVLGPDGRNICRTIEEGTMLVRLLNPEFGVTSDVPFLAEQDVTCPDNQYSISADNGDAPLRVELPVNDNLDALPWRTLDRMVPDDGVNNVRIERGSPLGGRARLDGHPFEGVFFNINYEFNPNFAAAFGVSGPDGRWMEFFGRSPTILQNGRRYFAFSSCGATLGTRQLRGFPDEAFLFPSGRSALNCELETAAATRFTHTFTRLAVTPFPGDIGGWFGSVLTDQYGVGYGVQFPIPPGESPIQAVIDNSHIFRGGLLVGIAPEHVLAGVDLEGTLECGPACHDLGLDGTVEFSPPSSTQRRAVTWRYSDAGSAERIGLRVTQRSIDGSRGHDYVLFRFVFRNTSRSTLRFHAGFVGDWDVDFDAGDDRGFTALDGRLMHQTSSAESGIHVGTMLLGEVPVSGNHYFFLSEGLLSLRDQVRALNGGLRRTTAGPGDLGNIHGMGPIRLQPQETQDIWIAVVAGENRAQLLANARAAQADVAGRLTESIAEEATSTFNPPRAIRRTGRTSARPDCKDCKPQ